MLELLRGAFEKSASTGQPVPVTLERGLLGKAQERENGQRGLLLWRPSADTSLPSAATCARLALASGFLSPVYKQAEVGKFDGLMMTDSADWGAQCFHAWGKAETVKKGQGTRIAATCELCQVETVTVTRVVKGVPTMKRTYDGRAVSDTLSLRLTRAGPVPQSMTPEDRAAWVEKAQAQAQALQAASPAPAQPEAQAPTTYSLEDLRGEVCGLCRHGMLTIYRDIECQLGWPAHDPEVWFEYAVKDEDGKEQLRYDEATKKNVAVTRWVKSERSLYPHGEAALPILAPQTRCMCRAGSQWLPRRKSDLT